MSNKGSYLIQMQTGEQLPTNFAISIAKAHEIIKEDDEYGRLGVEIIDQQLRMKNFQQMAIVCPFNECMIAYHGYELTEEQIKALELIYKSTRPWLLGATVGILLDRINNSKITNKDFALSLVTILEQLNSSEGGMSKATERMKGLVYQMVEPDKNAPKK